MSDRKNKALHNGNYFKYLCQLLHIVYCVADVSVLFLFLKQQQKTNLEQVIMTELVMNRVHITLFTYYLKYQLLL